MTFMINFLLRTIFRGNLTKAISLVEIDVTFRVILISANEIDLLRFPRKIFLTLEKKSRLLVPYIITSKNIETPEIYLYCKSCQHIHV